MADLLKQVSDPTRLQVLMLLNEQERNVSELCTELGTQSQPAVSHHLALLRHGRLIEPRRSGKHNFYGLTDAGRELAEVVDTVLELIAARLAHSVGHCTRSIGQNGPPSTVEGEGRPFFMSRICLPATACRRGAFCLTSSKPIKAWRREPHALGPPRSRWSATTSWSTTLVTPTVSWASWTALERATASPTVPVKTATPSS